MIQPNFSELEWRLQRALELMLATPNTTTSRVYTSKIGEALEAFRTGNAETDLTYNGWRAVRGEQMRAFRSLRRSLDILREKADEHALDDIPSTRVVYTDEEELIAFTKQVISWLGTHKAEWSWIPESIQDLEGHLLEAKALKVKESEAFQRYVVAGKVRVAGYDEAFGIYRDFVRDGRNDFGHLDAFDALKLRVD